MVKYKITDKLDRVVEDSRSFTVTPPVFEWAMAENAGDIFAKYAYLRVKAKDADKVTFYHNGSQLTDLIPLGQEENGVVSFVWNNLTAGQFILILLLNMMEEESFLEFLLQRKMMHNYLII